jgi:hypothetical protein
LPFKFGKFGNLTTTTYKEDEFFVFLHNVSPVEGGADEQTPSMIP